MNLKTAQHYDDICMSELPDGYYFVKSSHMQKGDFGMSMQRIIVQKDDPYILFHGCDEPELDQTIKGSFIKIEYSEHPND